MSDAGSERGARRGFGGDDGKVRDFGNWERKGPLSPATPGPTSLREGGRQASKDGYNFRKNSPSWGEGRSQDGSRPPRREFTERPPPERQPTAPELDNQWRARMKPDAPKITTPEASEPSSPAPPVAAAPGPATRPKLNLQKRTVSEADPVASPAQISDAKASPFGAARPVDTAAKEKEVEEKRQLAIRQKKEADDKAKAERAEEKRLAREKADTEKERAKEDGAKDGAEGKETRETKESNMTNENGEDGAPPTPKFDILRRADSGMNDMVADEENDDAEEQVQPTDDKAVKPRKLYEHQPLARRTDRGETHLPGRRWRQARPRSWKRMAGAQCRSRRSRATAEMGQPELRHPDELSIPSGGQTSFLSASFLSETCLVVTLYIKNVSRHSWLICSPPIHSHEGRHMSAILAILQSFSSAECACVF